MLERVNDRFPRALRRRREHFATWPTIGTSVIALRAMLVGLVLPSCHRLVQILVEIELRIDRHPLGHARDIDSAIDIIAGSIGYAALAGVVLWRLPRLGRASLEDLGVRALRLSDVAAIAMLSALNVGVWFVLPAYYRLLHASNHVQAGFKQIFIRIPLDAVLIGMPMVLIGPFAEELLFRGIIFYALARRVGTVAGALFSGLLFSLLHGDPILLPFSALQRTLWALAIAVRATVGTDMRARPKQSGRVSHDGLEPRRHAHLPGAKNISSRGPTSAQAAFLVTAYSVTATERRSIRECTY